MLCAGRSEGLTVTSPTLAVPMNDSLMGGGPDVFAVQDKAAGKVAGLHAEVRGRVAPPLGARQPHESTVERREHPDRAAAGNMNLVQKSRGGPHPFPTALGPVEHGALARVRHRPQVFE